MGLNLNAAREKFSDEEIARRLSSVYGFNMDAAIESDPKKFTPTFIAETLSKLPNPTTTTAQPATVQETPQPTLQDSTDTIQGRESGGATGSFELSVPEKIATFGDAWLKGITGQIPVSEFKRIERELGVDEFIKTSSDVSGVALLGIGMVQGTQALLSAGRIAKSQLGDLSPTVRGLKRALSRVLGGPEGVIQKVFDKELTPKEGIQKFGKFLKLNPERSERALRDASLLANQVRNTQPIKKLSITPTILGPTTRLTQPPAVPSPGTAPVGPVAQAVSNIITPPPPRIDPIPPAETRPVEPEPISTLTIKPKPVTIRAKPVRIPTKPKRTFNPDSDSLVDFVRKSGGLKTGGALSREVIDNFSIKEGFGLLNNKTGLSVDAMRESAQEAGFINMDTPDDLLRQLGNDVFAKKNELVRSRIFHPAKNFTDEEFIKAEDDFYQGLAESVVNPFEEPVLSGNGVFNDVQAPGAKSPPRMTQSGLVSAKDNRVDPLFLELPELVELAERISGGKIPRVKKELRRFGGFSRGRFNSNTGEITFSSDIFTDLEDASATVGHEIGHMIDWLPDKDIRRGNILGRIASLKKFMRGRFLDLASNQVIRDQLKALSAEWRPFPANPTREFVDYRNSSVELYGDALSVLLNDPVRLKTKAPDFYDGFFEHLDKKPEIKATYDDIQNRLHSGNTQEVRVQRLRDSFVEADKAYDKELEQPKWLDQLKTSFVDANHRIIQEVKNAGEGNVPAGENPRYKLEEMAYSGAEAESYMSGISNRVVKPLRAAGLNDVDIGEYLFHRRVTDDRSEIANPLGWNEKNSLERLFEIRERLTPDQFRALEAAGAEFWNNRNEMVVSKILESGIFSEELNNKIEDNVNYVTFDVAKFLEQQYGRTTTAKIYKQIGTLQRITNPFTATILKDISLISSINRNVAAESVVNFLNKFSPDKIREADKIKGFIQKSKNPQEGLVIFQKEGKVQGFYVDKFIADSFDRNPYEGNFIGRALRATAAPFRTIFTELNPGFWMFNIYRDFFRASTNLPKANVSKFLPFYLKGIAPAFRSTFGVPDEVVNEMLKNKMLVSVADFRNASSDDVQIEKLLKRFSLKPKEWDNKVIRPFGKILNFIQNTGRGFERTTKVASFKFLKEKYPDLTNAEIGHIVRTQGGSPDFMRLGTQYPLYNNLLLFSNAMKEGYRGDFEAAANNPTEFFWKKTKYAFIPKLVMFAASLGMLGDDNKEIMDKTSEYDKSNYHIIPLGLTESNKAAIMRIPVDEGSRFLGGIMWKMMNLNRAGQIQNIFDYMAGQAPALNPAIDAVVASVQYASGRNPYDSFRGRYAIPERVFEAGGERAHIEFGKWLANKSGSTIVYRFKTDNVEKIKSEVEEVIGLPVVNNIVGRFIKVTDQGLKEQLREAKQEVRIRNSQDVLNARDALAKIINKEVLNDQDIIALSRKPDLIDRNVLTMLSRRHGWSFAEALLTSRSQEERAAVLVRMNELEVKSRDGKKQ